MARTLNEILKTTTNAYLNSLDVQNPPDPLTIEANLLQEVRNEIEAENVSRDKGDRLRKPSSLSFSQIADIMVHLYPICRIASAGENSDSDNDLLAIYQNEGEEEGIYVSSDDVFRGIARQYNYSLTKRDFAEVMVAIRDMVPRKKRTCDKDLVAVGNGIFDYKSKTLLPFSPEFVFTAKSKVNYNPNAKNITIKNPDGTIWNVEDWMKDLSDDPEIVNLLWEILGAIIRPHVRWNKSAWFYSETGNNGKGTLCELMRNLCGENSYASIPISDFSKDFLLEPLTRATAIIVDENDVGTFVDKAANLKAIITNDVIQINRKFKMPIAYRFYGFMVQCLNEFPRIKDKSDSFYRRQLFIPFEKNFTGKERKYIKNDYLGRKEVLEYVLYRVLNMNYYQLSEPAACMNVLAEYKEFNDPIRLFYEEIMPDLKWDLLPFTFLYELYTAWFKQNSPSGTLVSSHSFIKTIIQLANDGNTWYCRNKQDKIRTSTRMNTPEPMIIQYQLKQWMNPNYKGNDPHLIALPQTAESYRGLQRITAAVSDSDEGE